MATPTQIILIIACACVVDCHYMRARPHKHQSSPVDHQATPTHANIKDSDAVVFPRDDNIDNVSKKVNAIIANNQNNDIEVNKANTDSKVDVASLISKMPAVEVKDIFTNPVVENMEMDVDKIIDKKDKIINIKTDKEVTTIVVQTDVKQTAVNKDNNMTEIKVDDSANSDKTTPDLSTRFGAAGNYLLVPVANNQNYQPMQTNANIPYYNTQGIASQAPTSTVSQFATNIAPNIGSNQFTPNVGPIQYPAPNVFNPTSQPNSNTYVPINVPNTYMINGQLYAAVTVPNNLEVLSPLYYVNPQTSGYQVQNNVPLYKLVTMNDGSSQGNMNGNSQFVSS